MSEFLKNVQKELGDSVHVGTESVHCWDTGVYALNRALGGGIPAGRMSLLCGKESTCKSTIAAKLAARVSSTHRETGEMCSLEDPNSCNVLYCDQEGAIDRDWVLTHGYNPDENGNIVLSTDTGNQIIDVINAALQSGEFSLIILDSLEACQPHKDLDKSSESFLVGTRAKMINDAYRRFQVAINASRKGIENWWQRPTFLAINQLRDAISIMPKPPTLPGGIGQKQFSSTIIQMNSPQYSNDGKLGGKGTFRGVIKKNKVATPRVGFEFEMALKEIEGEMSLGEVDNVKSILKDIRQFKMWQKDDNGRWDLFGHKADKQDEFGAKMRAEPDFELEIMNKVIQEL